MTLAFIAVVFGLALLVWSADRFVEGSAATARHYGMPPLLIGMVIVGFGTSAPEMVVSALAASQGNPGIALGNAYGSNIANIGLILGTTALIMPLSVHSGVLKREYPLMLAISLISLALMWDGSLDRIDGILLIVLLVATVLWMVRSARRDGSDPISSEFDAEIPHDVPTPRAVAWLTLGLLGLLLSSRALVWGAANVASALGVSDVVIGLTIVAIGTSLPELAASIASALKGEDDIAIGNVIGSNLYNILAVLSLPGLIAPGPFLPEVLYRDQPTMIGLTVALFLMGYGFGKQQGRLNRLEGLILLCVFVGYQTLLFFSVVHS